MYDCCRGSGEDMSVTRVVNHRGGITKSRSNDDNEESYEEPNGQYKLSEVTFLCCYDRHRCDEYFKCVVPDCMNLIHGDCFKSMTEVEKQQIVQQAVDYVYKCRVCCKFSETLSSLATNETLMRAVLPWAVKLQEMLPLRRDMLDFNQVNEVWTDIVQCNDTKNEIKQLYNQLKNRKLSGLEPE